MKATRLRISVTQDGLLPQETAEVAQLDFPMLPKKLLKALGFERVDSNTYVGVLPVFVNLTEDEQEIEIELGITVPEMRKKVIEIVRSSAKSASKSRGESKSGRDADTHSNKPPGSVKKPQAQKPMKVKTNVGKQD
ncbi:MAG: hypothetical protein ACT4NX_03080 [Deltaproteobacteria bacterium]